MEDADAVPRHAHDALHKMLAAVRRVVAPGKLEDDDVAAPDLAVGQDARQPALRGGVGELVDQEVIADQ